MLFLEKVHGFKNNIRKSKAGIWLADTGLITPINNNILFVLDSDEKGPRLHAAHNIVTNTGDIYYAQLGAAETPTDTYAELSVSTNAWSPSPAKASDAGDLVVAVTAGTANKAAVGGYPQTNDGDADNTGAGIDIVSWKFLYAKSDFNDPSIVSGAVHETGATFGSGTDPVLTAFDITSFAKTADDTLAVFVNHDFLGV